MKRVQKVLVGCFLVLCVFGTVGVPQGFAEDAAAASKIYKWNEKLGRGLLNMVSCPVEIARQINVVSNEQNLLAGWTYGLVKGVGYAVLRLGAGAADVVTCPFDWPKADKAPLMKPEYVWENTGVKYA